ncbi:unnamed protein product [Allacma fusca]|uniref:LRRNT domain-containing protein n=1 Tax=Allacma fusca TaxID=39272 RepID=A0A8J2KKI4_9HEXA|nr:unnamed protein product [Allacma fusca]
MREKVTILLILLVTLCQAECPIECFCDEVSICSGGKRLTLLPELHVSIPVARLELHDFLVEHLTSTTFLRLVRNITELRLTNNPNLISFDNDTFSTGDQSEGLGPTGSGSSSSDNESEELEGLLHLRTLDLSGNAFKYFVGGGRLKRLRVLDLSSNNLQQVYHLQALSSLESVNLRDNQLDVLQETLFQVRT